MSRLRSKGPVWANGQWLFPCRPPTYTVGPEFAFKALLRHVACYKHVTPEDPQRYSPTCVSQVACWYTGTHTHLSHERPSPDEESSSSQTSKCNCREDGEPGINDANFDILDDLQQTSGPLIDAIRCVTSSKESDSQADEIIVLGVYIVWEGDTPTFSRDGKESRAHISVATPRRFALMRERGKDDYIQVDFITRRDDESIRRLSMLKSLQKLAKKASKHCNREDTF
ncbi:hypothetical protein F5Y12DRAFT_235667 [Xylaria sp. FL1777]|nr:hypothetical protein F5Y12DRAFT_235667 [Xylaria sp. FL1777]